MNFTGTERISVIPYKEWLDRKEQNPILRVAKLARSIGGGVIRYPFRTLLATTAIFFGIRGIELTRNYMDFMSQDRGIMGTSTPASPPKEVKTSLSEYEELEDYIYHVLRGKPVGPDSKNISSLLPDNRFAYQIRPLPNPFPAEVVSPIGVRNRWLPVKDELTELPEHTWKQKGEFITDGSFIVTLTHNKPDGKILITEAIARRTPKGWEFNADKHTDENHITEVLIKFPNH